VHVCVNGGCRAGVALCQLHIRETSTVTLIGTLQIHARYSREHETSAIFPDLGLTREGVPSLLRPLQTPALISHSATHWLSQVLLCVYLPWKSKVVAVVVAPDVLIAST
jgi:hypothetical protein